MVVDGRHLIPKNPPRDKHQQRLSISIPESPVEARELYAGDSKENTTCDVSGGDTIKRGSMNKSSGRP